MKENLEELNAQGVKVPVLLGGAALTRDYAEDDLADLYKGPLLYCKDAFDGLHVMDRDRRRQDRADAYQTQRDRAAKPQSSARQCRSNRTSADAAERSAGREGQSRPAAAVLGPARRDGSIAASIYFPFINEIALFRGQWGFKQGKLSPEEFEKLDRRESPAGV